MRLGMGLKRKRKSADKLEEGEWGESERAGEMGGDWGKGRLWLGDGKGRYVLSVREEKDVGKGGWGRDRAEKELDEKWPGEVEHGEDGGGMWSVQDAGKR